MITVKMVSGFIDRIAPYSTKCEWDNCGLLVGNADSEVRKVGFCLDLTSETLAEAKKHNVDLIVTHHPIIFRAQKNFLSGNMAYELAKSGINAISAHTCFDCADGGVNDYLCSLFSIRNSVGVESEESVRPMARVGDIDPLEPDELASFVAEKLHTTVRLVEGKGTITRVAVCGGAGMSFANEVISCGAQGYITGDISHHEMLEAKEKGLTVVAAGHFETEYYSMASLQKMINKEFSELETVLLSQSNPVRFIKYKD